MAASWAVKSGWDQLVAIVEAEGYAAFLVATGDDERRALDELELEHRAAEIRSPGAEACIDVLEDDSFASALAEGLEHRQFIGRLDHGAHRS